MDKGPSGTSVRDKTDLIGKDTHGNTSQELKLVKQVGDPALISWVVIKRIAMKVIKLRVISFQSQALKKRGNIGLNNKSLFEDNEAVAIIDK